MYVFARRSLLALPAKAFALLLLRGRAVAAPQVTLEQFLALSTRLTGRSGLDPQAGRSYLTALLADTKNGERLADLVRGRSSHEDLERDIILSWYTGMYKAGEETRVATHGGALIWKALKVPPPATCAGQMGFWARPPEAK